MFYFTSRILHLVAHFVDLAAGMYQLYSQKCWIENQHMVMWQVLSSTQRQAGMLIRGPSPTQRPDFSPLTGHNPGLLVASLLDITP